MPSDRPIEMLEKSEDDIRLIFLREHSGTPNALLGDRMEREAYLDILVQVALDASATPRIQRGKPTSRA